MGESILQFARDFERLKVEFNDAKPHSAKLRLLLNFWPKMSVHLNDPKYNSYLLEYFPMYARCCSDNVLDDIPIKDHFQIIDLLEQGEGRVAQADTVAKVRHALIKKYFYVGDLESAVKQLEAATGHDFSIDKDLILSSSFDEYDIFSQVYEKSRDSHPEIHETLKKIYIEWEGERESVNFEGANCLLVEKDGSGQAGCGKLQTLTGQAELRAKHYTLDDLSFNEMQRTPDDRFVGVIYRGFNAVRKIFNSQRIKEKGEYKYHAHFYLEDTDEEYTGDSIGLAAALVTYIQLLKPDTTRYDKYISAEAAFTGSIDSEGNILPVNEDTLPAKLDRAFFSPIKYLAIPSLNMKSAEAALAELNRIYPYRKLYLIPADTLHDILSNHNINRDEKLCLGPYLARKAKKYKLRSAVGFAMIFFLIGWYILAELAPKTFDPWFDWRIDHLEFYGAKFNVVNRDGYIFWTSPEFPQPFKGENFTRELTRNYYFNYNVDTDGQEELFFTPPILGTEAKLYLYDDDGTIIWEKYAFAISSYPGDSNNQFYITPSLLPYRDYQDRQCILTVSGASYPMRSQFLCFNQSGDIVSGPYINTGAAAFSYGNDFDYDGNNIQDILIFGINNRANCAFIAVIDPNNLSGVSPPFGDDLFKTTGMPRGSQLVYVLFPKTRLSLGENIRNVVLDVTPMKKNGGFEVRVSEGAGILVEGEVIISPDRLPILYYRLDRNFIPTSVAFGDRQKELENQYLSRLNIEQYNDEQALYDSQINEIIVYHGDSIVHHPTSGVNYYHDTQ